MGGGGGYSGAHAIRCLSYVAKKYFLIEMNIFGVVLSVLRMRQNSLNLFAELEVREIPAPAPAVSYMLAPARAKRYRLHPPSKLSPTIAHPPYFNLEFLNYFTQGIWRISRKCTDSRGSVKLFPSRQLSKEFSLSLPWYSIQSISLLFPTQISR